MSLTRRRLLQALLAAPWASQALAQPRPVVAAPPLLDDIEQRAFRYFWETTDAATGLAPDRWPTPSFASVAAVGFALTAYPLGVMRGWVTREAARERVSNTLRTFLDLPQGPQARGVAGYKGFFYHFLDMQRGVRYAQCELSTIDTALLLAGALHCQSFFDGGDAAETTLRSQVDELYGRVDWRWAQVRPPSIGLGWHPETGFILADWLAYNEAMILYLLALASPTQPVGPEAWKNWIGSFDLKNWGPAFGRTYLRFEPMFGHQFTQCWVDLRGLQDDYMRLRGIDYFENSRLAAFAQRAYASANPGGWHGYGGDVWGVTACDGPADVELPFGGKLRRFYSYAGRGMGLHDDGTIAPYGAGGCIAFAPEIAVPALVTMHERWGEHLYGRYGFFDAFNPSFTFTDQKLLHGRVVPGVGWFDTDYLGIDQGPLLAMLGNHRGEAVWGPMRRNPHLRRGLQQAGFRGGWLA